MFITTHKMHFLAEYKIILHLGLSGIVFTVENRLTFACLTLYCLICRHLPMFQKFFLKDSWDKNAYLVISAFNLTL